MFVFSLYERLITLLRSYLHLEDLLHNRCCSLEVCDTPVIQHSTLSAAPLKMLLRM